MRILKIVMTQPTLIQTNHPIGSIIQERCVVGRERTAMNLERGVMNDARYMKIKRIAIEDMATIVRDNTMVIDI